MDLSHLEIPPRFADEDVFEDFCADLAASQDGNINVNRNGRRGQRQHGIDVFGRNARLEWFGIQCKVRAHRLSTTEILEDVTAARSFNPRLTHLCFYTTAPRDAPTQEYVRELNTSHPELVVDILFWEDLASIIKLPEYRKVLFRYFRGLFISAEERGDAYGRLISLTLGVDRNLDTNYELMIIRSLPGGGSHSRIDHYRDVCFLVDLNGRKIATFTPGRVYSTDFEGLFLTRLDREVVTRWLNQFNDIDDLISGSSTKASFSLPLTEYHAIVERFKADRGE